MATQTTIYTAANNEQGVPRTYLNKEFYDKNLLVMAKTKFVHAQYGQKKRIPKGRGKKVEFRRMVAADTNVKAHTLAEGVTPAAQDLSQTNVEATVKQYGSHYEVSDLLEMTSFDDIAMMCTDLLGEQLGSIAEHVTRDAMCAGDNVIFANSKTSRISLAAADKLTTTEVRKAVRELKKAKANMFGGVGKKPHFICICSPDATYDLQSDTLWQDVSKYSNAQQIYDGEIGQIFGVVFVESTEAKVYKQSVLNKVNAAVTSDSSFVLKNDPTDEEAEYLSTGGNKIKIGSTEYTLAAANSYVAATKTVTVTATFTAQAGLAKDDIVYSEDAGAPDTTTKAAPDVHAALVFGRDAYGTVDIDGSGAIESIIHGFGEVGNDPLNQRCHYGAKIKGYTAVILADEWLVRIEHGVTA